MTNGDRGGDRAGGLRSFALALALLLVARTFQYFPGMGLVQEAAIVAAPLALLILALRHPQAIGKNRLFEIYVIGVMVVMPLWSGFTAMKAYGQPPVYGILAWRGYGLLAFGLFVLYALRARVLSIGDIDRAFVGCAWGTLLLFALMNLLLDAGDYVEYGLGFVEDRHLEGYRFKFNAVFTTYAMFHYVVRAQRESRPEWILPAGLFALFLFGSAGGRVLTVSVLVALLLVQWHWGGLARVWRGAVALAMLLAVVVGLAAVVAPEATEERLSKFSDAFMALSLEADLIDDPSAASRALQVVMALPMIEEYPWAGNGRISSQWVEEGYVGYLGAYFFPDDIGVLGMVLQFGVVGTLILAAQFAFAWRFARRIPRARSGVVGDTAETYLAFLAISSVATGAFVMFPEFSILLISILAALSEQAQPSTQTAAVR